MSSNDFREVIRFEPAHDCISKRPCHFGKDSCRPGTGGSHGRGSVRMRWVLIGPKGAVQFLTHTGWMLDETPPHMGGRPLAADLGYHWPEPMYAGQSDFGACEWLDGATCYYDGSGLAAEEPWRILREQGDGAVWEHLRAYYGELVASFPFVGA